MELNDNIIQQISEYNSIVYDQQIRDLGLANTLDWLVHGANHVVLFL